MSQVHAASQETSKEIGLRDPRALAPTRLLSPVPSAALLVIVALGIWHFVDPTPLTTALTTAVYLVLILVTLVVPFLRGARPLSVWGWLGGAAALLLLALGTKATPLRLGPVALGDVFFFAGYLFLCGWLLMLTRMIVGPRVARRAGLDAFVAFTISMGSLIALYRLEPHASHGGTVFWALYPILDIVVISTATHLTFRVTRLVPAWWWIYGSLFLNLLLDVIYAVHGIGTGERPTWPLLALGYMIVYLGLALGATDLTIVDLAHVPLHSDYLRSDRLPRLFLIVWALLVIAATTWTMRTARSDTESAWFAVIAGVLVVLSLHGLRTMADISHSEADSTYQATHDRLTGLLNRHAFHDLLRRRRERDAADGTHTALLLLDIDAFRYVNDAWGHQAGDEVLQRISTVIGEVLGEDDDAARQGGDEFVVATTVTSPSQARDLAELLRARLGDVLPVSPHGLRRLTPSIGVSIQDADTGESVDTQFRQADVALAEARSRGRNRVAVFDETLRRRTAQRDELGTALREALRTGGILPAFQPICGGPRYRRLTGFESLARWTHPPVGPVSPTEFIPLAEELGLIGDLGDLMLRSTCRELAALRERVGRPLLTASVNVSAAQLLDVGFVDRVAQHLHEAGLTADALVLEITESLLVEDDSPALATIRELREMGLKIALDDFGTGYASLSTLLRLPLDYVKVDRSIVTRIDAEAGAVLQLKAVLDLVTSLGISQVVAEGVETPAQAAALDYVGFSHVQGYLFGRPQHPTDFVAPLVPPVGF